MVKHAGEIQPLWCDEHEDVNHGGKNPHDQTKHPHPEGSKYTNGDAYGGERKIPHCLIHETGEGWAASEELWDQARHGYDPNFEESRTFKVTVGTAKAEGDYQGAPGTWNHLVGDEWKQWFLCKDMPRIKDGPDPAARVFVLRCRDCPSHLYLNVGDTICLLCPNSVRKPRWKFGDNRTMHWVQPSRAAGVEHHHRFKRPADLEEGEWATPHNLTEEDFNGDEDAAEEFYGYEPYFFLAAKEGTTGVIITRHPEFVEDEDSFQAIAGMSSPEGV